MKTFSDFSHGPADQAALSRVDDEECPVWHLTVTYNGTSFAGWQIQDDSVTVQGELQERLRLIFRVDDLKTMGTSRTDAGVHALDQHVTFTCNPRRPLTCEALKYKLNHWLPHDIRIVSVSREAPAFSARYSALAKAYTYVIDNSHTASPFYQSLAWHYPATLNISNMRQAAQMLEGTHDFTSLSANPRRDVESAVRTIHRLELISQPPYLCINVIGDSFLYKMVRTLAGYLVLDAGRDEKWAPGKLEALLAQKKRSYKTYTAPGCGLFLAKVFFGENAWTGYQPILPPFSWHPAQQIS